MEIFNGILIPFLGTTLGAACVFFMKHSLSDSVQRALTGFAAGVMVAASVSAAVGDSKKPSPAPALRPKEAEPTTEPLAEKKEEASCEDEEAISGAFNAAYVPVRPKE